MGVRMCRGGQTRSGNGTSIGRTWDRVRTDTTAEALSLEWSGHGCGMSGALSDLPGRLGGPGGSGWRGDLGGALAGPSGDFVRGAKSGAPAGEESCGTFCWLGARQWRAVGWCRCVS